MQAGVAAFFSAPSELLQNPSELLVCVHSEILGLVGDENSLDDAPKKGKFQYKLWLVEDGSGEEQTNPIQMLNRLHAILLAVGVGMIEGSNGEGCCGAKQKG
jgi:hypothetical protein